MERVMGIGPTQSAWKADILPLNYTRISNEDATKSRIIYSMLDNIITSTVLCQEIQVRFTILTTNFPLVTTT